jgi:ATP-dependent 26S proteasome regulatory subunit
MSDAERLGHLLDSQHACISILTFEEAEALEVVRSAAMDRGLEMFLWSVTQGVRDGMLAKAPTVTDSEHPSAAMYYLTTLQRRFVAVLCDVADHLKDPRVLRMLRETIDKIAQNRGHVVLIDQASELPQSVRALATPFEMALPGERELEELLRNVLVEQSVPDPVQVNLTREDLQTIVRNLRGLTTRQARQVILDSVCCDHKLDSADINKVLAQKRRHLQATGVLDFVESPVDLDEIGGLRALKYWLEQRRESLCDEAVSFGLVPPRGVLMLGVQGAGKSLAAKAVATAWKRPLLRLDAGALYEKFIGESEKRLREALHQAEVMAPLVLWIDEIEKAFASAASQSADGGLSKRMFGHLLTWMQEHKSPVFLIATANDIEALPPELLRKGRFDEIFFVDLPDEEARRHIFQIHLKKRKRDPRNFDLERLAKESQGRSGAEIEQAIIAGMHKAFAVREQVTTEHIVDAMKTSPPLSVTMSERMDSLRAWARGRCVPSD